MENLNKKEVIINGGVSMYPKRVEVIKKIKEGKKVQVNYELSEESIIAIELDGNEIIGTLNVKEGEVDLSLFPLTGVVHSVKNGKIVGDIIFPAEKKTVQIPDINSEIKRLISLGMEEKDITERIEYLKTNNVSERIVVKTLMNIKPDDYAINMVYRPETLFVDKENILSKTLVYFNSKKNLLFEGNRGVGKNVLTETLSWLYCRPLFEMSLNSQMSNSAILGNQTFDEFGKIIFKKSPLIEAMEVGGILVLDEFNAALSHVMLLLNSVLDDRRRIDVPSYKRVVAHENFAVIATQNTSAYTGVFRNNEATLDRFVPIIFNSSPQISELIMQKLGYINGEDLSIVEKIYEGINNLIKQGEISDKSLSVRGFIDACSVLEDISLRQALIDNVVNKAVEEDREPIQTIVDMFFK